MSGNAFSWKAQIILTIAPECLQLLCRVGEHTRFLRADSIGIEVRPGRNDGGDDDEGPRWLFMRRNAAIDAPRRRWSARTKTAAAALDWFSSFEFVPPARRLDQSPYAAACASAVPGRTPMNAHRVAAAARSKRNSTANIGS